MPIQTFADFGITPSATVDNTLPIQAALDAMRIENAPNGGNEAGILLANPGVYKFTQLHIPHAVGLIGAGPGSLGGGYGTYFFTDPDFEGDGIIIGDDVGDPNEFVHWTQLANFFLNYGLSKFGEFPDPAKTGNGIVFPRRMGESNMIDNIHVRGFPENGLVFKRGGGPGTGLRGFTTFDNGDYGVRYERTNADEWWNLHIEHISGDDNGRGLVYLENLGNQFEHVHINNLKSESHTAGRADTVIMLNNCRAQVSIEHVSCRVDGTSTASSVCHIKGTVGPGDARVDFHNFWGEAPNLIRDDVYGVNVPMESRNVFLHYALGKVRFKTHEFGTFIEKLEVGETVSPLPNGTVVGNVVGKAPLYEPGTHKLLGYVPIYDEIAQRTI